MTHSSESYIQVDRWRLQLEATTHSCLHCAYPGTNTAQVTKLFQKTLGRSVKIGWLARVRQTYIHPKRTMIKAEK